MFDSRLHYLVAVARNGSFTAASRAVGVTQSAITKSIADLEKEIGYSVFYRTSRGVVLTEQGREFVDRASRLLDDARELMKVSTRNSDPYAGVLRIGVCPASLEWRLVEPLATLLRQHPAIRYDVSSSNFETVVQHLRSGTIDVALGFDAAFAEWSDLRREPMGELASVLFVRQGHPLDGEAVFTIDDIARFDFVSPSDSRPYGEIIRNWYDTRDVEWQKRVHQIDYFPLVRRIVGTSNAIGVAAQSFVQTPAFHARFVALPKLELWPVSPLCCVVRARWEPKPAVRAFISTMRQSLPPQPATGTM